MNMMLEAALAYRRQGWSVIPIRPGTKEPAIRSWKEFQEKPADEDTIRAWWGEHPEWQIAVVTGRVSGLVVIDCDSESHRRGLRNFSDTFRGQIRGDVLNYVISTPSRGSHLYFHYPKGVEHIPCRTGLLPLVDVRADGGYVLAPPSRGYTVVFEKEIPELPAAILEYILHPPEREEPQYTPPSAAIELPPATIELPPAPKLVDVVKDERAARHILRVAGRPWRGLEAGFLCVLHEERHPSASFWRGPDGITVYRDWHKRTGREWYHLPDVYAALVLGEEVELNKTQRGFWAAKLGLDAGILQLTPEQHDLLYKAQRIVDTVVAEYKERASGAVTAAMVERVWGALREHLKLELVSGFEDAKASVSFLLAASGTRAEFRKEVNRAANLLAVAGVLIKHPQSGGRRGDRWLLNTGMSEKLALARLEALGWPGLSKLNKKLVARKLGPEVANAVFRRAPEAEERLVAAVATVVAAGVAVARRRKRVAA